MLEVLQAEWAARNGVEHLTHLNHEDKAMLLARSEGDYFRDMRTVQIPGVDVIWNQVWPDSAPANWPRRSMRPRRSAACRSSTWGCSPARWRRRAA